MGWQVKVGTSLAIIVLLGAIIYLIDRHGYDRGMAECQSRQRKVNSQVEERHEKKAVAADQGMQKAIDQGTQAKADSEERTKIVIRTLTKVIHDSPSPVSCIAQPASVQQLADAIQRANAATDSLQRKGSGASPSSAGSTAKP